VYPNVCSDLVVLTNGWWQNLVLMLVTVLALIQTIVVHRLWYYGETQYLALAVDRSCNSCLIFFAFPGFVLGTYFTAFDATMDAGIALLVVTPIVAMAIIVLQIRTRLAARRHTEKSATVAFIASRSTRRRNRPGDGDAPDDDDDETYEELLTAVFVAFDRDETGVLSITEVRRLLKAAYPHSSTKQIRHAIGVLKQKSFVDKEGLALGQWVAGQSVLDDVLTRRSSAKVAP